MSKKMRILVLGSLFLNALLVAVVIGHVSHRLERGGFGVRHMPRPAIKLPADKEALFFKTMERVKRENRKLHEQIREIRERTLAVLTAPEFDEAAYQREVEKLHDLRGLMMQRLADATKDLGKRFSREEREALAEHLRRPPRWGGGRHRGGPPPFRLP